MKFESSLKEMIISVYQIYVIIIEDMLLSWSTYRAKNDISVLNKWVWGCGVDS